MSTSRELPPLPEQLRDVVAKLRTTTVPLATFIPLLQKAADAIEAAEVVCDSYASENQRLFDRAEAATADTARKCVEVCEAQRHFLIVGEPTSDDAAAAIRSEFPAAFNQEQSK